MNGLIKQIEKGKPFFEKISRNIYLSAICDGFLTAMPAILFSKCQLYYGSTWSVWFCLSCGYLNLAEVYGYTMESIWLWLRKSVIYHADAMNRQLPKGKTYHYYFSHVGISCFEFLTLSKQSKMIGGIMIVFAGARRCCFIAAFITVNVYKFCVIKYITIKMLKEVPEIDS